MKRLSILIVGVVAILAIVYGVRMAERRSSSGVAALLPRDTVAFAHVPDFNGVMKDWHRSDIYQIYLEPAVQEFLKKPLSRSPKANTVASKVQEFQELDTRDGFIALTSAANDKPKIVAGFEFHCSQSVADRVIGGWRSRMNPSAKRDHVTYQKHDIELVSQSSFSLATVQDQNWFFASNDLEELKAVLDRADGRSKDREKLLTGDQSYQDAISAMPTSYALLVYFQPKTLIERLAAARQSAGNNQPAVFDQIRSVCLATRFDGGKLHDVTFMGMPREQRKIELTRNSLNLASQATVLYAASVIDFSKQIGTLFPTGPNNPLGPAAQKMSDALAGAGIGATDWEAAFAPEFGMISEWPEQVRWPSLVISAQVKDQARAKKIIDALIQGATDGGQVEQADRDGTHYWYLGAGSGMFSIRPVMALSPHVWVTGLDSNSVEATVRDAQKAEPDLSDTDNYRRAVQLVPKPTHVFTYVDPAQIYSRIDATVRPILLMGAAFLPGANDFADLSKVPPPEAITKHLSPIVFSQYYAGKGYVSESVGPLTLNQAGIGVAVAGGMGAMAYQRFMPGGLKGLGVPIPSTSTGSPSSRKGASAGTNPSASPQPRQTP